MADLSVSDVRAQQLRDLVDAIVVTRVGDHVFSARSPDFWGEERVFGGMVVAQTLNAALRTVEGLRPHSLHGYFLRPVRPGPPTTLTVERLRDSRSFATRQVTAEQAGKTTFRLTCSFHVDEDGDEYQLPMPPVPLPEDIASGGEPPGPFDERDVGPLVEPDGTLRSSGRLWLRTCASLPDDEDVQACMVGLLSDMTRTSFRPLSLGTWGTHTDASIDHALWLHRPARADEWLFYDLQAVVNTAGRSVVRGSMYTRDGSLCMSMAQELLIRPLPGQGGPAPWIATGSG
jgi:acyl-CoA thioesterase-2